MTPPAFLPKMFRHKTEIKCNTPIYVKVFSKANTKRNTEFPHQRALHQGVQLQFFMHCEAEFSLMKKIWHKQTFSKTFQKQQRPPSAYFEPGTNFGR